jgi:hypothetical protein
MDHGMYHVKNVVSKFEHRLWDLFYDQKHGIEELLCLVRVILLDQVHQRWNNHWNIRHTVLLTTQNVE